MLVNAAQMAHCGAHQGPAAGARVTQLMLPDLAGMLVARNPSAVQHWAQKQIFGGGARGVWGLTAGGGQAHDSGAWTTAHCPMPTVCIAG